MEYYAHIHKSEGIFLVSFPDIPSINTYGNSIEEAKEMASEALNACLESDFERGYHLPKSNKSTKKNFYPIRIKPHIELAYQLKTLRNKKSQTVLAKELGISYQAYQKLENPRKCNPTIKTLEKISSVLGKNLEVTFS